MEELITLGKSQDKLLELCSRFVKIGNDKEAEGMASWKMAMHSLYNQIRDTVLEIEQLTNPTASA